MIPLTKPRKVQVQYFLWKRTVQAELEADFENYFQDRSKNWIKSRHLAIMQGFLFLTSHQKCAYCECMPKDGNAGLQVDHFYPKKTTQFRNKTFSFQNLLPCCPLCNSTKKQNYQKNGHEMLNPYQIKDISRHLALQPDLKIKGISDEGIATIEILETSLNSVKALDADGKPVKGGLYFRQNIQKAILEKIAFLKIEKEHFDNYSRSAEFELEKEKTKNRIYEKVKNLLEDDLNPAQTFTATKASIILNNADFKTIFEFLERNIAITTFQVLQKLKNDKSKFLI